MSRRQDDEHRQHEAEEREPEFNHGDLRFRLFASTVNAVFVIGAIDNLPADQIQIQKTQHEVHPAMPMSVKRTSQELERCCSPRSVQ